MIALPLEWPSEARPLLGGWALSTSHSASSYGIPVLISPEGQPFGPSDLLSAKEVASMRGINHNSMLAYLNKGQSSAGQGWMRVGVKSGWAIFAADALKT